MNDACVIGTDPLNLWWVETVYLCAIDLRRQFVILNVAVRKNQSKVRQRIGEHSSERERERECVFACATRRERMCVCGWERERDKWMRKRYWKDWLNLIDHVLSWLIPPFGQFVAKNNSGEKWSAAAVAAVVVVAVVCNDHNMESWNEREVCCCVMTTTVLKMGRSWSLFLYFVFSIQLTVSR